MLFRFLSVMGTIGLSSCAALALPSKPNQPSISQHHELFLHYSGCSAPTADCSQTSSSNSYLRLNFSTEDGVLLANNDRIFPPALPMQIRVPIDEEAGLLTYEIDAKPLPPRADGSVGDALLLKLNLFDLLGRSVTPDTAVIRVIKDAREGELQISSAWIAPSLDHHGHFNHTLSPLDTKHWRTQINAYFMAMSKGAKVCFWNSCKDNKAGPHAASTTANGEAMNPPYRASSSYQVAHYHTSHRGDHRAFLRLMRPVVLPALLGIVTGVVACIFGFLLGRICVAIYFFLHKRNPEITPTIVEEGTRSEKQVLMERDRMELE